MTTDNKNDFEGVIAFTFSFALFMLVLLFF